MTILLLLLFLFLFGFYSFADDCPNHPDCGNLNCCQLNEIGSPCQQLKGSRYCSDYCSIENNNTSSINNDNNNICSGENSTAFSSPPSPICTSETSSYCWHQIFITKKSLTREFFYFIPQKCLNKEDVCGVVMLLHGYGGGPKYEAMAVAKFAQAESQGKGIQQDMVVVLPTGFHSSWNGGECCGDSNDFGIDDIDFIKNVMETLNLKLSNSIDPNVVFMSGFSNGGFFVSKLVQTLPKYIKAAAFISGHTFDLTNITTSISIPIALYWSKSDKAVSFYGCCREEPLYCCCGISQKSPICGKRIGFNKMIKKWSEVNKCNEGFERVSEINNIGFCELGINCNNYVLKCIFDGLSHKETAEIALSNQKFQVFYFFRKIACEINGKIREISLNTFVCDCNPGWQGKLCLFPLNNNNDNWSLKKTDIIVIIMLIFSIVSTILIVLKQRNNAVVLTKQSIEESVPMLEVSEKN